MLSSAAGLVVAFAVTAAFAVTVAFVRQTG